MVRSDRRMEAAPTLRHHVAGGPSVVRSAQICAGLFDPGEIHSITARVYPTNNALFVNQESRSLGKASLGKDPVSAADLLVRPICQKPVLDTQFLGELLLTGASIHTDGQNLCVMFGEVFDIILIPCQFVPSATSEGQDVKSDNDILTSPELAEAHSLAIVVRQFKFGCFVTDLKGFSSLLLEPSSCHRHRGWIGAQ